MLREALNRNFRVSSWYEAKLTMALSQGDVLEDCCGPEILQTWVHACPLYTSKDKPVMLAPNMWYQKETSGVSRGTVLMGGETTSVTSVAPKVLITLEKINLPEPVVWSDVVPVSVLGKPCGPGVMRYPVFVERDQQGANVPAANEPITKSDPSKFSK